MAVGKRLWEYVLGRQKKNRLSPQSMHEACMERMGMVVGDRELSLEQQRYGRIRLAGAVVFLVLVVFFTGNAIRKTIEGCFQLPVLSGVPCHGGLLGGILELQPTCQRTGAGGQSSVGRISLL